MRKKFWLMPVLMILSIFIPSAVYAAGDAGPDIVIIAMGSIIGLIVVLVVMTFVVLPKLKQGKQGKTGNLSQGKSKSRGPAPEHQQKSAAQPGMAGMPAGGFGQQPPMPNQPRPVQPMGVQPGMAGMPAGGFGQPMSNQPRPVQPMGGQPGMTGMPAGGFGQPMSNQPRPVQTMGVQPGMAGMPAGGFGQPMSNQPRPVQTMGVQPGMAGMPAGGFGQQPPMPNQPRPVQPMGGQPGMAGALPVRPVPGVQPVQPGIPQVTPFPNPMAQQVYQVPVQARPIQPVSQQGQQYAGMPVQGVPMFQVGNLVINPGQVKESEPVKISVNVFNQGTSAGQYKLVLRVNGIIEGISELTINPGMSQMAMFSVSRDVPGDYFVEADNIKGSFRVIARSPAVFSVSNLAVNPEKVKQGEPAAISFIVTNSGDSAGYYTAVLKIKGIDEIVEDIPVEPNSSQMVTFNIIKDVAGFFPVSVENLSTRFVVEMDWQI